MIENTLRLFRPAVRELGAYQSARSLGIRGSVYLDANESPWAPAVGGERIHRYPDPQPPAIVDGMAQMYGVSRESVLVGRGSDEAIDVVVRAFCESGRDAVLIAPPTYGVYEVAAGLQGARVDRAPTREADDFRIDPERLLEACTPETKLVFLCTPNNPTGGLTPVGTLREIAAALEGRAMLVVDEAYLEFADAPSFAQDLDRFTNVIVLRTLSKAWAMAGARCGAALAHPEVIRVLQKVRAPYPIPTPVADLVATAIGERGQSGCRARVAELVTARTALAEKLRASKLIEKVYPSFGNFLLVKASDSKSLLQRCLDRGIVVRDRGREPGLAGCVRITVGSEPENRKLLEAIDDRPVTELSTRSAEVSRTTKETAIRARVNLDGTGEAHIDTGIRYFDHMLEQIAKHGGFDLRLEVLGDLDVDEHHTVEDVALVLGEALSKALGDRKGIERYGFLLPMDEAAARVSLDLSGRPYLVFSGAFPREFVGELPTELVPHFFRSLTDTLRATLHIEVTGENAHHMVESCFKAVGRSLRQAVVRGVRPGVASTKGAL